MSVTMCLSTRRNIPETTPPEDHDIVPFSVLDMAGQKFQFTKQRVQIPLFSRFDKPLITGLQEIILLIKSSRSGAYSGLKNLNARCLHMSVYSCRCSYITVGRTQQQ